jgi:hypothetical protein
MTSQPVPNTSNTMPDQALRHYQRTLWNIFCWNYPADIQKILENTEHVHNDVLHYLYSILEGARAKAPRHLIARLASLPDTTAKEMVDALEGFNIRVPLAAEAEPESRKGPDKSKPYFHSAERECFWLIVLEMFKAGCLGRNTDGSARDKISDFNILHYLYRLDVEDKRCRRNEEVELRNPSHCWYHETSDKQVLWFVKRMWPIVEGNIESKEE